MAPGPPHFTSLPSWGHLGLQTQVPFNAVVKGRKANHDAPYITKGAALPRALWPRGPEGGRHMETRGAGLT
ncbi:Hypothetical predicted protein [Marmota monax]|uniref:Uncharacterized protein n=1 Tax=Marmota monax TaxID=9995 RepID=A0A5E4CAN9_MARMO|nr:Hypothetical predicted protein [Marmota monax]